ncbi:MAG: hypothetical protein GVY27_07800 [Deinococcus-Thermus bacterium]|nr:hypothetical protein [Deinococcota bacterium]
MARLRVNLTQGEFEVEGDEDFVRAYAERIEALLERLGPSSATDGPPDPPPAASPPPVVSPPAALAPATADEPPFGEWLQGLPRNATDVDRMLLAGLHLQRRAADRRQARQPVAVGEAEPRRQARVRSPARPLPGRPGRARSLGAAHRAPPKRQLTRGRTRATFGS